MSNNGASAKSGKKKSIYKRKRRRAAVLVLLLLLIAVLIGTLVFVVLWVTKRHPAAKAPSSSSLSSGTASAAAPTREPLSPSFISFMDANTASKSIVLFDVTADTLLYSKAPDIRQEPASITKLLTAALAIKYCPDGYVFTVGSERALVPAGSSLANLLRQDKLDLDMMLKALLLPSGNDAAYTVAAHIGRILAGDSTLAAKPAVDKFVAQMNTEAAELGMTNTRFSNPDGNHDANHYTTAADLLKLSKYALTFPKIAKFCKTPAATQQLLSGRTLTWNNTNKLLQTADKSYNPACTGLKTGSTGEAGYCLAASAEKDGRRIIAVILGSPTDGERWTDANGLLDIALRA